MTTIEEPRPWIRLALLATEGQSEAVAAFVHDLPAAEVSRALAHLAEPEQQLVLGLLSPEDAAEVLTALPEAQAVDLVDDMVPGQAAAILDEMPSDEQADILGELELDEARAILAEMEEGAAREAFTLASYPEDSAGGLMRTELLAYQEDQTVADVIHDLQANAEEYARYDVQYAYVVGPERELTGVLRLRDVLLAPRSRRLRAIQLEGVLSVSVTAPLTELEDFFDRHSFLGVPVVDAAHRLVGVVRRFAVEEAVGDRAHEELLKVRGIVGGEELRSMPTLLRVRRRLSWLSVNVALNVIAASVIAMYQETLSAVIALAVFLPIISDMSGCSGNQAVAVSMRELALGLVKPIDVLYVWGREAIVGVLNGLVLGLLIGLTAFLWKGSPALGLVVGAALAINTVVGVSLGGCIPLLLRRFGLDPALASGPILTTVTDMCGFFLVLSLATAALPWLTAA
jgi:magnesium transporter